MIRRLLVSINCDECRKKLTDLENRVKELESKRELENLQTIEKLKAENRLLMAQMKIQEEVQIAINNMENNPLRF